MISTLSPSIRPPASSVWLNVSPKSLRSIAAFAPKPIRSFPQGSFTRPFSSASSTTCLVTPCMVRSPLTRYWFSPRLSMRVVLNEISGKRFTWKKSAERRCASRCGSFVSMLAASIFTSTKDAARSLSNCTVPVHLPKRPCTLEITRCRIEKVMLE